MRQLFRALAWMVLLIGTTAPLGFAQTSEEPPPSRTRVAVMEFAVLTDDGHLVSAEAAPAPDLARLARLMPSGITARLVQSGQFDVLELVPWPAPFTIGPDRVPEEVRALITSGQADQVITGTVSTLQSSVVVTAQRYAMRDGRVALVGAAAAPAARVTEAIALADALVAQLFPPEAGVLEVAIEQVFVVPETLRLAIGESRTLEAFAVDAFGRPVGQVQFIYQADNPARIAVDETGRVTGLTPGQATVTVRAVGRPTKGTPTARTTVTVVPPSFGIRAGALVGGTDVHALEQFRLGLRLTPTLSAPPPLRPTRQVTQDITSAANDPLSFLSNVFASFFGEGLVTFELDFEPGHALLFTLDAVQRTQNGYLGTGVGFSTPLQAGGDQGVHLRLTLGTYAFGRPTFPLELNADLIFPTASEGGPSVRLLLLGGVDLFR